MKIFRLIAAMWHNGSLRIAIGICLATLILTSINSGLVTIWDAQGISRHEKNEVRCLCKVYPALKYVVVCFRSSDKKIDPVEQLTKIEYQLIKRVAKNLEVETYRRNILKEDLTAFGSLVRKDSTAYWLAGNFLSGRGAIGFEVKIYSLEDWLYKRHAMDSLIDIWLPPGER